MNIKMDRNEIEYIIVVILIGLCLAYLINHLGRSMKTNDRLRDLLTTELENLVKERDGARRKSLQYKEIAEAVDKQVNRLQHFLADYGPVNVVPDDPDMASKPTKVKVPRGESTEARIVRMLSDYFPDELTIPTIKTFSGDYGINPNSVSNCVRLMLIKGILYREQKESTKWYGLATQAVEQK